MLLLQQKQPNQAVEPSRREEEKTSFSYKTSLVGSKTNEWNILAQWRSKKLGKSLE